jgi:hypothetical protein
METPGVSCAIERKSDNPRASMSACDTAVILMAVFCTVHSRFSAVITISSRALASLAEDFLSAV